MFTRTHTDPCPTPAARAAARFSNRAAAVFLVGLAFVVIAISGLAVAIAPSGRIAMDIDWSFLGLGRAQWEQLHLTMGVVFIGAALWHIWLHWSVITNLLWSAAAQTVCHRREIALAGAVVLAITILAVANLPPASWIGDVQSWFKRDFW